MIPIVYMQLDHWTGIGILAAMTVTSLLIDVLMHYHGPTRRIMHSLVGSMLRPHEVMQDVFRLTGASWVLIAAMLTFLVFPKVISTTSFSVLIVSDTAAALIGRRYGKRRFLDKSLVGSMFFVISALLVTLVYQQVFGLGTWFFVAGVAASLVCAVVEAASIRLKLDDNISIPSSFALTMLGMNLLGRFLSMPSFLN